MNIGKLGAEGLAVEESGADIDLAASNIEIIDDQLGASAAVVGRVIAELGHIGFDVPLDGVDIAAPGAEFVSDHRRIDDDFMDHDGVVGDR